MRTPSSGLTGYWEWSMKVEVQGMTPYSLPPHYPVSTPGLSNMRSDYWSSEDKVSFQLSLCKILNFPLTKPLLLFIQHFSDTDGGSWTWHTWWMKYISIYWKSATNLIEYKFAVLLKVFLIQNTLFLKVKCLLRRSQCLMEFKTRVLNRRVATLHSDNCTITRMYSTYVP